MKPAKILLFLLFSVFAPTAETTITDSQGKTAWLYTPTDQPLPEKTYWLVVGVHGAGADGQGACGVANWAMEMEDVIVLGPTFTQPKRDSKGPSPKSFPRDIYQIF